MWLVGATPAVPSNPVYSFLCWVTAVVGSHLRQGRAAVAHLVHTQKVAGSNPAPAPNPLSEAVRGSRNEQKNRYGKCCYCGR